MIYYFHDGIMDKVEYDPSSLDMVITFASGSKIKLLYVLTNTFYQLTNSPNPYDYFETIILEDPRIGRG